MSLASWGILVEVEVPQFLQLRMRESDKMSRVSLGFDPCEGGRASFSLTYKGLVAWRWPLRGGAGKQGTRDNICGG